MFINFCYPDLIKNVSSDVVCSEGYEPTNLISSDIFLRKKGFLAERFVKPPVVLKFVLTCDVNINHIVIFTKVGSQKSIGIKVSSQNCDNKFSFLCSAVTKEFEDGFVFHKHGDKITHLLSEQHKTLSYNSFRSSQFLKASVIEVKIFKTFNATIPSLGKIEIWGRPSKNCSKEIVDNVYLIWNKIKHKPVCYNNLYFTQKLLTYPVSKNETCKSSKNNVNTNLNVLKIDMKSHICSNKVNVEVPEEFIDPITCEIMILPIILPSGKIIDSLTLEKYTKEESKWGRPASDPFTGKLITEKHKPIFANDLKSRIDKFLSDHSNLPSIKTLPRTIGRKYFPKNDHVNMDSINLKVETPRQDSSKSDQDIQLIIQQSKRPKISHPNDLELASSSYPSRLSKGDKYMSFEHLKHRPNKQVNDSYNFPVNPASSKNNSMTKTSNVSSYKQNLHRKTRSHEEESQFALDQALKKTLSTLPAYSDLKPKTTYKVQCIQCFSKGHLYKLPCLHLLCRKCLLTKTESKYLKCTDCKSDFKTCELQRFHS